MTTGLVFLRNKYGDDEAALSFWSQFRVSWSSTYPLIFNNQGPDSRDRKVVIYALDPLDSQRPEIDLP